jgi:hypothetical protein
MRSNFGALMDSDFARMVPVISAEAAWTAVLSCDAGRLASTVRGSLATEPAVIHPAAAIAAPTAAVVNATKETPTRTPLRAVRQSLVLEDLPVWKGLTPRDVTAAYAIVRATRQVMILTKMRDHS